MDVLTGNVKTSDAVTKKSTTPFEPDYRLIVTEGVDRTNLRKPEYPTP